MAMSLSGIEINKPLIVLILLGLSLVVWYTVFQQSSEPKLNISSKNTGNMYVRKTQASKSTWLARDLKDLPTVDISSISVQQLKKTIKFEENDLEISYLISKPSLSIGTLLLLHGLNFFSDTWNGAAQKSLQTIKLMSALGFTVIAIDLPGKNFKGHSSKVDIKDKGNCLSEIIKTLQLERPVIVSPSMSGSFALPLLLSPEGLSYCRGYVLVAPVSVMSYNEIQYKQSKIPALIIYGEKDENAVMGNRRLELMPGSEVFMLKNSRHAAYLDQPDAFNQLLYNFLTSVFS